MTKNYLFFIYYLFFGLFVFLSFEVKAQNEQELLLLLGQAKQDSNKINIYQNLVYLTYKNKNYNKSLTYIESGLNIAQKLDFQEKKAVFYTLLGDIYKEKQEYNLALKNYLQAERLYEALNKKQNSKDIYQKIAQLYQEQSQYLQAIKYYEEAYNLSNINTTAIEILKNKAYCHKVLKENNKAYNDYKKILSWQKSKSQASEVITSLKELAHLAQSIEKYQESKQFTQELTQIYQKQSNWVELSNHYNNLGFLEKRIGNIEESYLQFKNSLNVYETHQKQVTGEAKAVLLINTGVAYTNLEQYSKAKKYYNEALKIRESLNKPHLVADNYNYIATNYLLNNNNSEALKNVNQAIEIAEKYKANYVLLTSYELLAMIAKQNKDTQKEQESLQKLQQLEELLKQENKKIEDQNKARQKKIEKEENDLKNMLVAEEKTSNENRRLAIEKEKQEKEKRRR